MEQIQAQILEDERAQRQISNNNDEPSDGENENVHPQNDWSTDNNEPSQMSMLILLIFAKSVKLKCSQETVLNRIFLFVLCIANDDKNFTQTDKDQSTFDQVE